jgi:uncharacterized protein YcbK (DUF882 family)
MNKLITISGNAEIQGVDQKLITLVEDLAAFLNQKIIITSGFRQGDKGQHGAGLAVDLMCPGISTLDFYLAAERFPFIGIGVYSDWQISGVTYGGIHVDIRNSSPARWFGFRDPRNGVNSYLALSKDNLKKYGVI